MAVLMKMLGTSAGIREMPSHTTYCPSCGRWVLLDEVWGCRFCRTVAR
jgi:hypothetical protein